jgi:F-type H+-transporting ATPase subunit b
MPESPEFWVAVAFVIFVIATFRPISRALMASLDARSARIRDELGEAQRLREEAQKTLAEYQRKQRDALKETEAILNQAKAEAKYLQEQAAERTSQALKRREQAALDKIAQAEAAALTEVRNLAVDVAVSATRKLLEDELKGDKGADVIDAAIEELPNKLN